MTTHVQCQASGPLQKANILRISGHMGLSQTCCYQISAELNVDNISALLGQSVTITVTMDNTSFYHNGFITEATVQAAGLVDIKLESGIALLRLTRHSQIFQNESVPDIIKKILSSYNLQVKPKLFNDYPKLTYCVQYEESDFNFVSRLMEQAGIFYFFENNQSGETLILADQTNAYTDGVSQADFSSNERALQLYDIHLKMHMSPGTYTLNSYNFMQSSQNLQVNLNDTVESMQHSEYEIYHYAPEYTTTADGKNKLNIVAGAHNKNVKTLQGSSNYFNLLPGSKLNLINQPATLAGNKEWVISELGFMIDFHNNSRLYQNHFQAINAAIAYQSALITPNPTAPNVQLAKVIGPQGEEFNTDEYGRVQVEFPWNTEKSNSQNMCWLRSLCFWEGVLRVGTPVLVSFIDGDINSPVILGPLHEDTLKPSNPLTAQQTQSMLVRRHPDASVQKTYNSILFDDKKSAQLLCITATNNMQTEVKQNFTQNVAEGTYSLTVKGNTATNVTEGTYSLKIKGDITIETEGSLTINAKGGVNIATDNSFSVKAKSIQLEADNSLTASGTQSVTIKGQAIKVAADNSVNVSAPQQTISADAKLTLKGGIIQEN